LRDAIEFALLVLLEHIAIDCVRREIVLAMQQKRIVRRLHHERRARQRYPRLLITHAFHGA
jgi:hypothetical protein